MSVLRSIEPRLGFPTFSFWCPGCGCGHAVFVTSPAENGAQWKFNGDLACPTFTPSIRIGEKPVRCHLHVENGYLRYEADCTHELAGKTVEMEPFPS